MKVQGFQYTMKYVPGPQNPCDYMSRHPRLITEYPPKEVDKMVMDQGEELCISHIIATDLPSAITIEMLQKSTAKDQELQKLIQCIKKGHITQDREVHPYKQVFSELTYTNGVILRGERLVIPKEDQTQVVDLAHEGHQGETKTKQLLRSRVWFPNMDGMVRERIKTCIGCQASTPHTTRDPLKPTTLPDQPWQKLDIDFKGPLPSGEYLLVCVDEYSRYPEVEMVHTTAAKHVIPKLDRIFATHGYPQSIKTDGGPPFNGHEFREYMKYTGIRHRVVSPDDPEANGLAENFMKVIKKVIAISQIEKRACYKNYTSSFVTIGQHHTQPQDDHLQNSCLTDPTTYAYQHTVRGQRPPNLETETKRPKENRRNTKTEKQM